MFAAWFSSISFPQDFRLEFFELRHLGGEVGVEQWGEESGAEQGGHEGRVRVWNLGIGWESW